MTNPGPGGGDSDDDNDVGDITPDYQRPTLRSITPDEIESDADELLMTLNGSNFFGGSIVNFGGEGHSPFDSSANQLRVLIPGTDLEPGSYAVSVTNPGAGTSRELGFEVTVEANPVPVITGLEPVSVEAGSAGFVLMLEGHGFIPATRVTLGGTGLNARITPETVEVDVAAGQVADAGTLSGLVTNEGPGGGSAAFSLSVTTVPAAITSFAPTVVSAGTDVELRVFGSGFTAQSVVLVADTRVATEFVGAGELIARIPAVVLPESGEVPVEVLNLGPGGNRAAGGLLTIEVPVPVLSALEPALLALGDLPARIRVLGAGFLRSAVIQVDGIDVATAYAGPGELGFTMAGVDVAGVFEVTVTNPGPIVSAALPLTIGSPVPVLREIVPAELVQDALPAVVRVLGDGFGPTSVVLLDGVAVEDAGLDLTSALQLGGARVSRVFVDGGTLEFEVPAGTAAGEHTVQVETPAPGGGTSDAAILTILNPVPVVTTVTPNSTFFGVEVAVEVTGSGFVAGAEIYLDGLLTGFTDTLTSTTLTGRVPAHTVGTFRLTVRNPLPGGGESNAVDFTVLPIPNPAPGIDEVIPTEIVEDHETELTIRGSNFLDTTRAELDGDELRLEGGTSRRLRVTLPALPAGSYELTVINDAPGGGRDTVTIEVKAAPPPVVDADIFFKLVRDPTLIVEGNEQIIALSLSEPLDFDLEVTATIGNSAVAGIVDEGSTVVSVTDTIPAGEVHASGPIKGVAEGTTTLTVTADGFDTVTATIRVLDSDPAAIVDTPISPSSIVVPLGGTADFTVTRFDDTQGAAIAIGTSTAPDDKASVDPGVKFAANALTATGTVRGLEEGTTTLTIGGVDAPSLLTDHVINFLPPDVDLPPTVDLQTSGDTVAFGNGGSYDDAFKLESLPFTFPFFDRAEDDVYVSTNGYLTFGAGDDEYEWDTPEEFLSLPRIAAFATDLYLFSSFSDVFTNEITIEGCDAFVVTYEDMGIFFESGLGGIHTFQIVLFETGAIQFRYGDINNEPSDTEEEVWIGVSPQPPQFDRPHGIWSDGIYLYVTERGNSSVRRIEIATREVKLLAGDPNGGSGTADGIGTAARFDETAGIWGDGNGSVYIAERANHAIRKLNLATGEVTTIAGLKGSAADAVDGTGTAARFGELGALWGDGDGNLYVADAGNHVIRKIVIATGEVTTLAGTFGVTGSADDFGADAGFYEPWGVWGDNLGNLYIGEDTNATIRKIVIATGEVTTVAGDADTGGTADGFGVAARLDRPRGLWGDNMGHLYFSEVGNDAIRKVDLATGEVTTLAGLKGTSGFADGIGTAARFNFPNAIFGHGGYLYIVDDRNHVIRRMDISTLEVESFVGWAENNDLKDGTGALTPVSDETPLNSNYTVARGFIYDRFDPESPDLISVGVTVTGTPTLSSIAPNDGDQGESVAVTLTGSDFVTDGTSVSVSGTGVAVSNISVSSLTSLTASFTIDSGAADGARNVTVTTAAGTSGAVTFTVIEVVPAPVVSDLDPDTGTQGSMVEVTITGENFSGTAVNVSGTGVTVPAFSVDSPTQITAFLVLSGTAGNRNLTVTTSNGTSNNATFEIEASPVVTAATLEVDTILSSAAEEGVNDSPGSVARFSEPNRIWGVGGFLYVTDEDNHIIRRIDKTTGETTTFAGTKGIIGTTDGTGTAAKFSHPEGIWGDGLGNLYIVDSNNHTIRKIVIATKVVTTFAGMAGVTGSADDTGTAASFSNPEGIFGDSDYLYIADSSNHTIRKIEIATQEVTTLAGGGGANLGGFADDTGAAARFSYPQDLWSDGTYLYVADKNNNRIRQIEISTGDVTTLAGDGAFGFLDANGTSARFASPEGLFGVGNTLYVGDSEGNRIRKIDLTTDDVTTLAGSGVAGTLDGVGTSAELDDPSGLWSDGTYVYSPDEDSHRIRKVEISTGTVTTLAGGVSFDFPQAISGDDTSLYVSDTNHHVIKKVSLNPGATTILAGKTGTSGHDNGTGSNARFTYPEGTWSNGTYLYVADTGAHTIRRVTIATGAVTTLAGEAGEPGYEDLNGTSAEFEDPHDVWGDQFYIYVADKSNHVIRRIEISTGDVDTFAGSGTAGFTNNADPTLAEFSLPLSVWGNKEYLFVSEGSNHAIRKINFATGEVSTLAGSGVSGSNDATGVAATFNFPHGITGDGTYLYVAERDNHTIRRVEIATGEVTTLAGDALSFGNVDDVAADARFNNPMDIHTDGQHLYVVDGVNDAVKRISPRTITSVAPASILTDSDKVETFTLTGSGFTGGSTVNMTGMGEILSVTVIDATTIEVEVQFGAFDDGLSRFSVTTDGVETNIISVSIQAGD